MNVFATTPGIQLSPVIPSHIAYKIKSRSYLPPLLLEKFDGNYLNWQRYYNCFFLSYTPKHLEISLFHSCL